jgi:hypothetical protein
MGAIGPHRTVRPAACLRQCTYGSNYPEFLTGLVLDRMCRPVVCSGSTLVLRHLVARSGASASGPGHIRGTGEDIR